MLLMRTRMAVALAIFGMGGLLSACGDVVDNAMGINGSPNWNVPLVLEGRWAGQPTPNLAFLVSCLQRDSMTEADIPHVSVQIEDGEVKGALTFRDGGRLDLRGWTWAGAPHTGHNLVSGKTFFRKRDVGYFSMEPDGVSGRLQLDIWFDRPDTGGSCAFYDVILMRVS